MDSSSDVGVRISPWMSFLDILWKNSYRHFKVKRQYWFKQEELTKTSWSEVRWTHHSLHSLFTFSDPHLEPLRVSTCGMRGTHDSPLLRPSSQLSSGTSQCLCQIGGEARYRQEVRPRGKFTLDCYGWALWAHVLVAMVGPLWGSAYIAHSGVLSL